MQIVYIGAFRFPHYDAAAARVLNIARAFRDSGHNVKFISWGGKYSEEDSCSDGIYRFDGFEYSVTDELDLSGTSVHKVRQLIHRGEKSIKILSALKVQPDLVIAYNADYGFTRKLLKYCKARNIKFANDITEWYEPQEMYFFDRLPYYFNMKKLQHKVKNKIVISSYLDRYFNCSNNLLLPPLCEPKEEKWAQTVNDERITPFDGITLFYAGTPAKKDCLHTCINVVNKIANEGFAIRFIILGSTKEDYLKKYSDRLEDTALNKAIMFLGRTDQINVPAYYRYADFMLLLRERTRKNMAGFPTKVAESFTAGVPVISNDTSDLSKYIIDGHSGFLLNDERAETLYSLLVNKIIELNKTQIEMLKSNVNSSKSSFDCHSYKPSIDSFLSNLR